MSEADKQSQYSLCNTFTFALGFIYYPDTSTSLDSEDLYYQNDDNNSEDGSNSSALGSVGASTKAKRASAHLYRLKSRTSGDAVLRSNRYRRRSSSISTASFDDDSTAGAEDPLIELGRKFHSGKYVNEASYDAAFLSSVFGPNVTTDVRHKFFDFCRVKNGNCSMVTFTLVDLGFPDWSLSNYYYQLLGGACQDSVSLSDKAL
jgi:hypothetical protein